jgi:tRNA threonylcarbamoyladenosine biosynthesis protein TsaE
MTAAFEFVAKDERDTDRFGAALAQLLPAGAVVALVGTLGAGKTRLVQAVAKAVGVDPGEVLSPTFVLVHEYRVQGSRHGGQAAFRVQPPVPVIYHIDAYRIRDDDEFRELGSEECFESDGWTFIEWADRVDNCLPGDYLEITIAVTSSTARRFAVMAHGRALNETFASLRVILKTGEM